MNCRAAAREAGLGHDSARHPVGGAHCAPENTMPLAAPLRRAREGELPCSGKRGWPGPRLGAPCMPNHNGIFAAMRRRHTRGGRTKVPPASCESPPLPSGRAARARVSNAFRLPPGCHCDRQGIGCHLRTVRVPFTASVGARNARPHNGTRPERRLHGNGKHKSHIASTSAPRGLAQN